MVEIKSLDLKNYRFAGYEATKWPTEFSPWPSAMGNGNHPPFLSPVRTTEIFENFELIILNHFGPCTFSVAIFDRINAQHP